MRYRVIGVPTEVKDGERRVALDPVGVSTLARAGHDILVQAGAGAGAGYADTDYASAGARIVPGAADVWEAGLVVKVKEPQPTEFEYLRPGLALFCYLHLAAEPVLAEQLRRRGVDAYAFETLTEGGVLPLLAPMSEIAGRAAPIAGAQTLAAAGSVPGSGTLLGGAAGVPPARVVVIGLGVAGGVAARGARGLDAQVTGVEVDLARARAAMDAGTVSATLASAPLAVADAVADADLVIGAALVPGARAPVVLTEEHVRGMRPGSVIVDLAIDQGGCIETSKPTTLSEPVFEHAGVVHYCVTNVPGQFPRTATQALSAAIAPYVRLLASSPQHPKLQGSLNVSEERYVHDAVAAALHSDERTTRP